MYLTSLKDLPLKSALKNVYLIPDNVRVHLVDYNLPKSAKSLNHDVLRCPILSIQFCNFLNQRVFGSCLNSALECLDQEVGDTVSLRGRIVDRMHVLPRFASEKVGQAFKTHRGTWLGIPGGLEISSSNQIGLPRGVTLITVLTLFSFSRFV